jgi:hypothetical protein
MQKNVASQKWTVFAFDRTDNSPQTGDAANITANIKIDGGAAGATNDTNPTELEDGYYEFDLTQAETNGNLLQLFPASGTADIQVIGVPGAIYTSPLSQASGALLDKSAGTIVAGTVSHDNTGGQHDRFLQRRYYRGNRGSLQRAYCDFYLWRAAVPGDRYYRLCPGEWRGAIHDHGLNRGPRR